MDNRRLKLRREFLRSSTVVAGSFLISGCGRVSQPSPEHKSDSATGKEEQVSPAEDLMREHGVLERVLLIYEEGLRRLESGRDFDPATLASSAGIVRRFIEDYHEKLEEEHLLPRFERAGNLVELVNVLRQQHLAGRRLTEQIQQLSSLAAVKSSDERRKLGDSIRQFTRMYRPHAAREDTVLFPAFRALVAPHEYDALGEEFEDQEHKLFGEDGFEKIVDEVAALERKLGIDNLAQFTPAQ